MARRVIVIDDDAAVLDSTRLILDAAGYDVGGYQSAEDFLRDGLHDPACLILDHHMPGMTGLELAAHLQRTGREVPILLVTGAPSPIIEEQAARLGLRVLPKPVEEADLMDFVERHCPATAVQVRREARA